MAVETPFGDDTAADDEYVAFFRFVQAIHRRAERAGGGYRDHFLEIGDRAVQLRFVGDVLPGVLLPALEHLRIPARGPPSLRVLIWDSASSGTKMPFILSRYFDILGEWWNHLGRRGEITELSNERIQAAYHLGPNIFSIIDLQSNLAMYWTQDATELPYYEVGSPLRTILHWWADRGGHQFVHAGAVGWEEGGVLLAGKGGTGKSTTALACLEAGMLYASDDYCLIRTDPEPFVFSIYSTAKLRGEEDLARFPRLAPLVRNRSRLEDEKAVLFVHEHLPERVAKGFAVKAILLPRITNGSETRLSPATRGAALGALAPTTLMQLPGSGDAAIKTMSQLVQRTPAYYLDLGANTGAIAPVIRELIPRG